MSFIQVPDGEKLLFLSHLKKFSDINNRVSVANVKVENGVLRSTAIDGTLISEIPLKALDQVPLADKDNDGKMSKEDFVKLQGISQGANRVTYEGKNGFLNFDGEETQVFKPETFDRDPVDVFNEALL